MQGLNTWGLSQVAGSKAMAQMFTNTHAFSGMLYPVTLHAWPALWGTSKGAGGWRCHVRPMVVSRATEFRKCINTINELIFGVRVTESKKCVNAFKMIVIKRVPKIGPTLGLHFASSAVSTTWTWDGVHHHVFWGPCVCLLLCLLAMSQWSKFTLF